MKQQQAVASRQSGVTLMELMVTLVIIAILASVAIPQYSDYVTRGKVPQATNNLSTMRARLEQYFQDNRTYVGACVTGTIAPLPADDDFTYACNLTATTYTVTATGRPGAMRDFTYSIDESNRRRTLAAKAGWGTVPKDCWISKNGGAC
jgi:type IV pilus assembly protein PilE